MQLDLRCVSHRYDIEEVLSFVSLSIQGGEVVALLGPNGSGKSTLLNVASRTLRPVAGTVCLDGRDIASLPVNEVARKLGALEPEVKAGFDFTVKEVVELGRLPHVRRFQGTSAHDEKVVQRVLLETGATTLSDRQMSTLSSGERQRVWLAMALAQEPKVLLLDEPTAFLDLRFQISIMEIIVGLAGKGMAVLMATHDVSLAAAFARRLVLMNNGAIVAVGSPVEVLTKEYVRKVYGDSVRLLHEIDGTPVAVAPRSASAVRAQS